MAGCLSGTSADGVDVALVRFEAPPSERAELLAFATLPFPADLGARVRGVLDGRGPALGELARLDSDLGTAFGRAVRDVAREHGIEVELCGSHGQTVFHHDGLLGDARPTLQLGDGDAVAEALGAPVACDFRRRDVAAGGEGAPLVALVDHGLFAAMERPGAVLNLGGMANVTVLGPGGVELGFDTGPAGALLDGLARRLLGRPYDDGGARAAAGEPVGRFVDELLRHPFFDLEPPKSTGRDTFGEPWVDAMLARARALGLGDRPEDVLASAALAVARSAALAIERFVPAPPRVLALAGGGVHHAPLVRALGELAPCPVVSSSELGVDPDAREAIAFALLARRRVLGVPSTDPNVTGARAGSVLGKLTLGPAGGR